DCMRIGLSVREGVANAYNHGNRRDRNRKMFLKVEAEIEKKIVIHILDEGNGFELEKVPDPMIEEKLLKTYGRGLCLMKALMDELSVSASPTGGTEVVMAKYVQTEHQSGRA